MERSDSELNDRVPDPGPHAAEMFPKLAPDRVARLMDAGLEVRLQDNEILWDAGDANIPFCVVLEGALAIQVGNPESTIVVHEPNGFSGDTDMLSGRPAAVRGRARGPTRVLAIHRNRLRELVRTDAELGETLLRAFILRRVALIASGLGSVVFVGSEHAPGTLRLQEFLTRNGRPYLSLDVDRDPTVRPLLESFHVGVDELPVVICWGANVLKRPSIEQLARCLGLDGVDDGPVRDLVVVGAGPAGLAAAVYAASEGLDVVVLESYAPGGQAGSSSRIENYLGFPTGIAGNELAGRAFVQAEKFGAAVAVAQTAASLHCAERPYRVTSESGVSVATRGIVIATGAEYRKPNCPDAMRFEGVGLYYAATPLEGRVCVGEDVVVVGGGNSAGQAAVFFSGMARHVTMLVRGSGLAESMSQYLIRRIEETPNIELRTRTEITGFAGDRHLESVTWTDEDGLETKRPVRHVFWMTGASPNTRWLVGCLALDENGFVKTGSELGAEDLEWAKWPLERPPYLFETSLPAVFAVGDVRAHSVKRVAAAVGEGSVCIQLVHKAIAELDGAEREPAADDRTEARA